MARLVTVLSNMVMFSFLTGFNEIFAVRAPNVDLMKGTKRLGENED